MGATGPPAGRPKLGVRIGRREVLPVAAQLVRLWLQAALLVGEEQDAPSRSAQQLEVALRYDGPGLKRNWTASLLPVIPPRTSARCTRTLDRCIHLTAPGRLSLELGAVWYGAKGGLSLIHI